MGRDFLVFWRWNTVVTALRHGQLLDYAASNQYTRVTPGDTVWVVSVHLGRLQLIGRVVVDQVTDREKAARVVGTTAMWPASHYILPVPETIRPVTAIDIHHLVPVLRFAGASDRLTPDADGLVSGQQLQAMRRLAGNSPQLLADARVGKTNQLLFTPRGGEPEELGDRGDRERSG